jgi:hypothetical protein
VSGVEFTDEVLSNRGGLILFAKYLTSIDIVNILMHEFSFLRKSRKGLLLIEIFKQVLCFFFDGTSLSLSRFDQLRQDAGYAGVIESSQSEMLSSHQAKRFFKAFQLLPSTAIFRRLLRRIFIWRLKLEQPSIIEITIDSMVMDNDDAEKRQGVSPTYKKVKGFQPLHAIWNGRLIDAVFRGGKKNGNAGNTVVNMIDTLTTLIRADYSPAATIVIRLDAGFFDQKIFSACDDLGVGFIATGKMYEDVKEDVR